MDSQFCINTHPKIIFKSQFNQSALPGTRITGVKHEKHGKNMCSGI